MQVSFSTKSIYGLNRSSYDSYSALKKGGYGVTVDAETFYSQNAFEWYGVKEFDIDAARSQFATFIQDCVKNHVPLNAVRMPHLRWDTKRTDLNDLMLQIGKEGFRTCVGTGCEYLVIQPLFAGIPAGDLWQKNHCYYGDLGQMAKQADIKILMENQCGCINGHLVRGACSDAATVMQWIDALNQELGEEIFGFCLDTGVCTLCRQDMGEMVSVLGNKVKAVRIRECDGSQEASRLPFTGRSTAGNGVDWAGLIRGLRKIEFEGILIMEASDTLTGFSHLLRPQVYSLICSVADYLKWQIDMEKCIRRYPKRVLFGAGNMCLQYMLHYGKQYPPLFICDNNPSLWGTKVHGMEVKAPETLKELPDECVVIICNTFYEEVAGQLKAMGVKRIGTFSDEYLAVM